MQKFIDFMNTVAQMMVECELMLLSCVNSL